MCANVHKIDERSETGLARSFLGGERSSIRKERSTDERSHRARDRTFVGRAFVPRVRTFEANIPGSNPHARWPTPGTNVRSPGRTFVERTFVRTNVRTPERTFAQRGRTFVKITLYRLLSGTSVRALLLLLLLLLS